jgi:hypothetical protein
MNVVRIPYVGMIRDRSATSSGSEPQQVAFKELQSGQ